MQDRKYKTKNSDYKPGTALQRKRGAMGGKAVAKAGMQKAKPNVTDVVKAAKGPGLTARMAAFRKRDEILGK